MVQVKEIVVSRISLIFLLTQKMTIFTPFLSIEAGYSRQQNSRPAIKVYEF